jgi:hypothetical protein
MRFHKHISGPTDLGPLVDLLVDGQEALLVDVGLADVLREDRNDGNIASL